MIPLFFQVKWFLFQERREVRRRFPSFMPIERALAKAYRFRNPYRISRKEPYGETPLPLLYRIAQECALGPSDTLFDLGCGRGRGALFLHHLFGCTVIGIDWTPFFIQNAQKFASGGLLLFRCEDMVQTDFTGATIIFLYGTCLSDEVIGKLVAKFEQLPPETKVVTVSYPLSDYSPFFATVKQFTGVFPWGEGELYLNQRSPFNSASKRA